jgi:protease-4
VTLRIRYLFLLASLLSAIPGAVSTSRAQDVKRIISPSSVFYYQPASSVFGSEAVWINPAGLGRYSAAGAQVMADYFDGDYAESWGWAVQAKRLSSAFRKIENPSGDDYHEWVFAAGVPLGQMASVGGSYRYFSSGPGYFRKLHSWTIGVQGQGSGPLAWGAVFSNLNRAMVNGEKTETEQRYSLAYRPAGQRLTLSADMFLSTKTRFKNSLFVYNLEYTPRDGLFVSGYIDSHKNWQIGVRANFVKYFGGFRSRISRSGHGMGTTTFIGSTTLRQPSVTKQPQRRLTVSVSGSGNENPPRPVFGAQAQSFADVLSSLYRSAYDPSVKEVLLECGKVGIGFAKAQELRDAIAAVRSQRKQVICHLSEPGNLSYFIATACDSIFVPPVSQLDLVGLKAELTFYAGTLEKLGVKIELLRIGAYKTAAEAYTRTSASEQNREQVNRLLDDLYDQFVRSLAEGRHISPDSVRRIVDQGPYTSKQALDFGLVDGLCYADEFETRGAGAAPSVSLKSYESDTLVNYDWRVRPVIAVVVAEGEITADGTPLVPFGSPGGVTPGPMRQALDRAAADSRVKGIVVRIDSPGGAALASDDIYHVIKKAARRKPVIVSMANLAASGGYYIAMPGDRVFADPATITGSIGIFGGKADLSGLYEKIALTKELYTRGKFSGMMSSIRPFTEEERAKYLSQLEAFYGHFVDLVAGNRSLPADSINHLGQGQVWTGREALGNGLVDELGGLQRSLEYTARRLGLGNDYSVEYYPKRRPWFVFPRFSPFSIVAGLLGRREAAVESAATRALAGTDEVLARLPYDISIQ